MKNKYFTNPELSKRLQEIGVVSQFDYWWCRSVDQLREYVDYDPEYGRFQKAYHWSDICLPENEFKIWPEYQDQRGRFAAMVIWPEQYELDWQFWLMSELTKQEGK